MVGISVAVGTGVGVWVGVLVALGSAVSEGVSVLGWGNGVSVGAGAPALHALNNKAAITRVSAWCFMVFALYFLHIAHCLEARA